MPNLGFGLLYGGQPGLRIARDNTTDLETASPTDYGLWQLDTYTTKLSYVFNISNNENVTVSGGLGGYLWFYNPGDYTFASPSTSSVGNTCGAHIRIDGATSNQIEFMHSNFWPFGYFPLCELRRPISGNNVFDGPKLLSVSSGLTFFESTCGYDSRTAAFLAQPYIDPAREGFSITTQLSSGTLLNNNYLTVFQLPMRDDALPSNATTAVSGQTVLLINKTTARLALPGRDVFDSDPEHYIFHENKIPAKIMAAGDINLPANGTATINCPLALTNLTYMDFHAKRATDTEFWHPPFYTGPTETQDITFTYQVNTNTVVMTSTTPFDVTVRYMVYADSEQSPTAGGKKVLLKGNDGTRDYVQIKRPGSSDLAPNLNDIMVDTRLAYVPIIAEGFLNWPGDFPTAITGSNRYKGERMATVSFANPSPKFLPFVKPIVVFPSDTEYPSATRQAYHRVFTPGTFGANATWNGRCSADSSWANIHDTSVDFYMAGDNPVSVLGSNVTFPFGAVVGRPQRAAIGLRYYIFGIPNGL